jgi:hypothetical protein
VGGLCFVVSTTKYIKKESCQSTFSKGISLLYLAVNKFEIKNVNKPLDLDKFDLDPAKELQ